MSEGQADPEGGTVEPPMLRLAAIFYGLMLAAALVWGAVAGRSIFFASAEAAALAVSPWRDLAVGGLAGAVTILVSGELTRRTRWGEDLARALAGILGRRSVGECLLLAVLSGVGEEAFFRGALQPNLGLVATSVIFGLAHFAPRRDLWPWTLFSLAAGFGLGWLFEATGNLLAPIVAHALVNGVNLRILSKRYSE